MERGRSEKLPPKLPRCQIVFNTNGSQSIHNEQSQPRTTCIPSNSTIFPTSPSTNFLYIPTSEPFQQLPNSFKCAESSSRTSPTTKFESKSKQATSRKKALEKLNLDDIQPSSRKYPFIFFKSEREPGNEIFRCNNLGKRKPNGDWYFRNVNIQFNKGEKAGFVFSKS